MYAEIVHVLPESGCPVDLALKDRTALPDGGWRQVNSIRVNGDAWEHAWQKDDGTTSHVGASIVFHYC